MDFTSKASKRRERSYLYTNLKKFLSLDDLYRLGFDSLSEPLFPRSAPLLSLRDIFPVSSGEYTPREKARISIKKVTFLSFPDNRCDLFCFLQSLYISICCAFAASDMKSAAITAFICIVIPECFLLLNTNLIFISVYSAKISG